jgi:hypothetical protein
MKDVDSGTCSVPSTKHLQISLYLSLNAEKAAYLLEYSYKTSKGNASSSQLRADI